MAKTKDNLRDKYKPVKLSDLKKKVKDEDSIVGSSNYSEFLEMTDGVTNKFRLMPPHSGADYYVLRKRYWITIEGENGDPVRRTVLDGKIHGGLKRDIIEEYVGWCTKNKVSKEAMSAIQDWKAGLQPQHDFIAYAVKIGKESNEFGLLNFKKTVRDAINKATFVEDDDEPIEVDPFTDLDEGLPLLIKYNSKPNKKKGEDFYDVQVGKKPIAIDDESLRKFDQAKPLSELYSNYGLSEFELALEGLRYFDSEHGIDAFDDDSWLETVEEIKDSISGSDDEEEDEKPSKSKKPSKSVSKKRDEDEEDDSDDEDEEDDDEDEKPVKKVVKKSSKKVVEEEDEEEDDDSDDDDDEEEKPKKKVVKKPSKEEDDDEEDDEDEEEEEKPAKSKGKMSLSDIKNRLKGGKK